MAIKDWNKSREYENYWEKGNNFVQVSYSKKHKDFRTLTGNTYGNRELKRFESKAQAMTYAKSYMRTH